MPAADHVVRAVTNDGAFRAIAARTDDTVRGALAAQGATGGDARDFGDLLTGAVIFRETMAPQLRVQCVLDGAEGSGRMVADAHPDGGSRGLLLPARPEGEVRLGPGALLRLSRELPAGRLQEGVIEVPPDGGISGALMRYMQESEQVVSVLAVGTLLDGGEVVGAGGWIVQLLPEARRAALGAMTERLERFAGMDALLRADTSPDGLLGALLVDMPWTRIEERPLGFRCRCSRDRVEHALATLDRADLEETIADGEPVELRCDYCGTSYEVPVEFVRSLLARRELN